VIVAVMMTLMLQAQTPPAPAAGVKDDVEALYAEGAALYRGGKYRLAIAKFEAAYSLFPEPNLLYNQARAYEVLGELPQAIEKYRAAAAHPQASNELRAKSTERLSLMSGILQSSTNAQEPRQPTPTTAVAATAPTAAAAAAPATVEEDEGGSAWPWVLGGAVGAVAVGGGVAAAMLLLPGQPTASTLGAIQVVGR
jgi:hypothetical protein